MYAPDAIDYGTAPYNTAYVRDDRTHLYARFDVDPALDGGSRCPNTGETDVPSDYAARREAILSFYGHRCGRCLARVATASDDERSLGYVHSLGTLDPAIDDAWALTHLVALCEPCYDVVSATGPDQLRLGCRAYERSQQFPQWLGDPRVAVERLPLSGRELWVREQLADELEASEAADSAESVNAPVADSACLARRTPAATAVALGEALAANAWQPIPDRQRLTARWELLEPGIRDAYDRCARTWSRLVTDASVPRAVANEIR